MVIILLDLIFLKVRKIIQVISHLSNGPSFKETIHNFLPKIHYILLKSIHLFHFPCFEITLNIILIDLIYRQFSQIFLGLVEIILSIEGVDLPKIISLQILFFNWMLIFIIKNIMQNFLCLNFAQHVLGPKHICNFFVYLIILLETRHYNKLLQSIIKMFLIVMEWRVFNFLYFFLFANQIFYIFPLKLSNLTVILIPVLPKRLRGLGKWCFLNQVEELRNVLDRISPFQVTLAQTII